MKYFLHTKIFKYTILTLFGLLIFSSPKHALAACQVESGTFRHAQGSVFQENWYINSFNENNSQPFIYLDLILDNDCLNQSVNIQIMEEDDGEGGADIIDNEVVGVSYTVNELSSLQQTLVFRAGGEDCELLGACDYYLQFTSNSQTQEYSNNSSLSFSYDCLGSCVAYQFTNQLWSYLGTVWSSTSGYVWGSYVSPNDPDLQTPQTGGGGLGSLDQEGGGGLGSLDQEGGGGLNSFQPLVIECNNGEGVGCIENPLGDGSSLPAFIESLLGIIIRAGIPIIVLALVYTGFRFVEARGNPTKIADAKKLLLYTVIGSAIVLGAWTIATILTNTINLIVS